VGSIWAVALAALVLGVALAPNRILVNRAFQKLGAASFSLYLLHPPIIGLMDRTGVIDRIYQAGPTAGYLLALLITLAMVVPLSLLSYRFIERPVYRWSGRGAVADARSGVASDSVAEKSA